MGLSEDNKVRLTSLLELLLSIVIYLILRNIVFETGQGDVMSINYWVKVVVLAFTSKKIVEWLKDFFESK